MKEWQEHTQAVEVPKGTGRQGFLLAIDQILKLPRVQGIQIDARGKVHYTRYIEEGEPLTPVEIDFETLSPHSVLRNVEITEVTHLHGNHAASVASLLFLRVAADRLCPLAFVTGANTCFWEWHARSTGIAAPLNQEEFFGLPLYKDRMIEDYMLFLCAGYTRGGALIDTQKSYKYLMPERAGVTE